MKCPRCRHDGMPVLSGPYDRPDGSRSAFYVCAGSDAIVPGHDQAAEQSAVLAAADTARQPRPASSTPEAP